MSSAYQCGVSLGAMIGVQLPSQGSVDLFDMLGRMNPQYATIQIWFAELASQERQPQVFLSSGRMVFTPYVQVICCIPCGRYHRDILLP